MILKKIKIHSMLYNTTYVHNFWAHVFFITETRRGRTYVKAGKTCRNISQYKARVTMHVLGTCCAGPD